MMAELDPKQYGSYPHVGWSDCTLVIGGLLVVIGILFLALGAIYLVARGIA